jgi:hypothetical protein
MQWSELPVTKNAATEIKALSVGGNFSVILSGICGDGCKLVEFDKPAEQPAA